MGAASRERKRSSEGYPTPEFLRQSLTERVTKVPANAQQDDFGFVVPPFEWVFHEAAYLGAKSSGEGYPTP
jgi:hypothetical protein